MYVPPHFNEDRTEVLHEAIARAGIAVLVTLGADGLEASHIPLLLDPHDGPRGTLIGHIARANPQWRAPAAGVEGLAIFQGPNAYVSPAWYPSKAETHRVVPTWNYVAVHARGPVEFFDDRAALLEVVTRLTEVHERRRTDPGAVRWAVSDAPDDYIERQLKGIVGVRLRIAVLEGKWKLNQNRTAADREGARAGLAATADPAALAVARLMDEAPGG